MLPLFKTRQTRKRYRSSNMRRLILTFAALSLTAFPQAQFNDQNELLFPADYREWIFLSSGVGMTYGPAAPPPGTPPAFDNVFVHPASWAKFKESGVWPEGTIFVLEIRYSNSKGSINQHGQYQTDVNSIEAAVKDSTRFPQTKWGYFGFGGGIRPQRTAATPLGVNAGCQACHSANGAVEQTFVQFYPTALAIAEKKGTVRSTFQPPPPSLAKFFHSLRDHRSDPTPYLKANASNYSEAALNMLGYNFFQAQDLDLAIAVLDWTAQAHPQSANAWDSLAEILEAAKQPARAREATVKAQQLLSQDSAIDANRRELLRKSIAERLARLKQTP